MLTGKTLPCFAAFDGGARSGGFIGDRFLSGQHPPRDTQQPWFILCKLDGQTSTCSLLPC